MEPPTADGTYAFWYPVKGRSQIPKSGKMCSTDDPTFCVEFVAYAKIQERLIGSRMVIFNPPWQFDKDVHAICKAAKALDQTGGSPPRHRG